MEVRDRSPLVLALQHPLAGMLCLALLVLFAGLGQGDVRIDGAIYAWISKWMVVSGDWLDLYYDHGETHYFNRPPLQFWLMAVCYKLFGINTWSAKLVSPVFGLLCIAMTFAIARFRYSQALSATAGILLTLTYPFFRNASGVRLDPGMAFFALVALWAGLAITRRGTAWLWLLMGVAWGLGMMIKSPIILLTAVITLATYAWLGRRDLLLNWRWLIATVVAFAIWTPWHLYQYLEHGQAFTSVYFGREMMGRLDGNLLRAWTFHTRSLLTEYWPWLPFAALGVYLLARKAHQQPEATVRLLILWITIGFVLAHLRAPTHDRDLIPWYPAVSIAAAYGLSRTQLWPMWRRWVLPNVAVISLALLVTLEVFNVQLHRTESPAVRFAAAPIREALHLASQRGNPAPRMYVEGLSIEARCRMRFYTDARVVAPGSDFDWSSVRTGDFIGLPPDSPLHGRLPRVLPIAEDRRLTIYRVIADADAHLLR